jgi:hypothetical protein
LPFKSLIGRFRISYTEDNRIREILLPAQTKLWNSIGPFPAEDVTKAYTTVFEPEKDIKSEPLDLKKSYKKIVLTPPPQPKGPSGKQTDAAKPKEGAAAAPPAAKPEGETSEGNSAPPQGEEKAESVPKPAPAGEEKSAPQKESTESATDKPVSEKKSEGTPAAKSGDGKGPPKKDGADASKKDKEKAAEPKKPSKDEAKSQEAKSDAPKPADAQKNKPKPEKITWTEQRRWRDGSRAQLQGANVSFYLTRKIVSTAPRTALVQIDGPSGFKMWLNGELVHSSDPPPPPPPPKKSDAKPAESDKEEPQGPDFDDFDFEPFMGRPRSKTEKRFRIGLRQGENEIVLKVVHGGGPGAQGPPGSPPIAMRGPGGGGSFSFDLTPEGDDVVTYEVATALRLEELESAKGPTPPTGSSSGATSKATAPRVSSEAATPARTGSETKEAASGVAGDSGDKHGPNSQGVIDTAKAPDKAEEKQKVSLVGEKSAPLNSGEKENKLSPSERRRKVLREYYRSHIDPIGRILAEELTNLKDEEKQVKRGIPQTLVMEELDKPRQAYIFKRGLYKNRGENVNPGSPAVMPPMVKDLPRNRLGLAKWLVSGQHPLTARVVVNRIWQQYFGIGIVRTAEDFGLRGELPTHPELLDFLATELVDSKWDLKKLHKRIVLSATYRQASTASKEKLERDPENRLLARGPRLRLTAEMVRDNALAVSGLLFEKIGGESVKPVQPENAWKTVEGNMASMYRRDRGEKQYRRALYVYWKRGSPYPSMLNFDAVKRDSCTVTRATTTTPLQALTLLNDPVYVECAKMLGQRMLKDPEALGRARDLKKPEQEAKRLAYGFRLCTSRPPTEKEIEILRKLLDDQRAHFKADGEAAKKLLSVGDAKLDENLDRVEAAAWASVGNALLNLDATIRR